VLQGIAVPEAPAMTRALPARCCRWAHRPRSRMRVAIQQRRLVFGQLNDALAEWLAAAGNHTTHQRGWIDRRSWGGFRLHHADPCPGLERRIVLGGCENLLLRIAAFERRKNAALPALPTLMRLDPS